MRGYAALLAASTLLFGCDGGLELFTDLKTDIVAGEEFALLEVVVTTPEGREVGRAQRVAHFGEDYVEGRRVLEVDGLEAADYLIRVTLLDSSGRRVSSRTTSVSLSESSVFTVLLARDSTECDESDCDPESTCGIGEACIARGCSPETPEECPTAECVNNADCTARAMCSVPICVSGVCLYADQAGACAMQEWCNPDVGCLRRDAEPPVDGGPMDAGSDDAGQVEVDAGTDASVDDAGSDAGLDAGVDSGAMCTIGMADCDRDGTCERDLTSDVRHCGGCGVRCGIAPNASATCTTSTCGLSCDPGWTECDGDPATGCEVDLTSDEMNCGVCGSVCPSSLPLCVGSDCVVPPFLSDGTEGPLAPSTDMVLSAGVHHFTTIDIPAGVTVTTDGNGVLELRATGDVVIAGIIDLSGGRGGAGGLDGTGSGSGGETGTGVAGLDVAGGICGSGGAGGIGTVGATGTGPCGEGGRLGGGAGGGDGGGGGGGGSAGGGGSGGGGLAGGAGGSFGTSNGGIASTVVGRGGQPSVFAYSGRDGAAFGCCGLYGAGGGSIGQDAVSDLAMATTFGPGSGGGGAGGMISFSARVGGGGGGGGGGALRISTPGRITLTGDILARGGAGGNNASSGGPAGGGGSGGAVYLAAPEMSLMGRIDTSGGPGGAGGAAGGAGGIGRIRISVIPSLCALGLAGTPTVDTTCVATNVSERVYIGVYPN